MLSSEVLTLGAPQHHIFLFTVRRIAPRNILLDIFSHQQSNVIPFLFQNFLINIYFNYFLKTYINYCHLYYIIILFKWHKLHRKYIAHLFRDYEASELGKIGYI